MCPLVRAHWRHLANTIELMHPSAHLSPQPKRQIDRFSSRFCTAHGRKSLYFTTGAPIHQNCSFRGGSAWTPSHLTRFLGPMRAQTPNGTSIGLAVFAQMTTECPYILYFTMVRPFPAQNSPFPCRKKGVIFRQSTVLVFLLIYTDCVLPGNFGTTSVAFFSP